MERRCAQGPGDGAGLEEDAAPPLRDGEEPLQLRGDAGAARPAAGARASSATCSIPSRRRRACRSADRRACFGARAEEEEEPLQLRGDGQGAHSPPPSEGENEGEGGAEGDGA
jgi:hypothetical protein